MKCLLLSSDKGSRCVPISRIDSVVLDYAGVINGKEQWVVYVTYAGDGEWHEYYYDPQKATDRYNKLVEVLMSY